MGIYELCSYLIIDKGIPREIYEGVKSSLYQAKTKSLVINNT